MPLKIAVIGCGPSGIAALRHLADHPGEFIPVAFEKSREVWGLWNYSDKTDKDIDEYGVPHDHVMYKNLRSNLPTEIIGFPDLKLPEGLPSFIHVEDVRDYLDAYVDQFDLKKYVKFQTIVTNVTPKHTSDSLLWLVTSKNLVSNELSTETFDRVIICNGKDHVPVIPSFPGAEKFRGPIIHIKNHRDHSAYKDKTIIVVGGSMSAFDIIFELGPFVKKMYVSKRNQSSFAFTLPKNVTEVPIIREILPNGVILENGECREVDAILFATGYHYSFPFLSKDCGVTVKDDHVQPLYNHAIHIDHPSLCFIGLLKGTPEFRFFFMQAHYVIAVFRGDVKLPSKAEMYRQEEEEYNRRVVSKGLSPKYVHYVITEQEWYIEKLAKETKHEIFTEGFIKMFRVFVDIFMNDYGNLKNKTIRSIGPDEYEII